MNAEAFNRKHRIFKHDGSWLLVRKSFGLTPHLDVSRHVSLKHALHAAGGTGGGYAETGRAYTPGYESWSYLRTNNYPMRIN